MTAATTSSVGGWRAERTHPDGNPADLEWQVLEADGEAITRRVSESDARLIAKARLIPRLLIEVKNSLRLFEAVSPDLPTLDALRALIAEAEADQ